MRPVVALAFALAACTTSAPTSCPSFAIGCDLAKPVVDMATVADLACGEAAGTACARVCRAIDSCHITREPRCVAGQWECNCTNVCDLRWPVDVSSTLADLMAPDDMTEPEPEPDLAEGDIDPADLTSLDLTPAPDLACWPAHYACTGMTASRCCAPLGCHDDYVNGRFIGGCCSLYSPTPGAGGPCTKSADCCKHPTLPVGCDNGHCGY